MKRLVSVIVNCLNGSKYLNRCIDSILNQTYQNFEIVFWDNNSTDNSLEIVKSYDQKNIIIYKNPNKTLKLYDARNQAIKLSHGQLISFLDTDDYWLPTKLEKQINILNKQKTKFVYSNYWIEEKENRYLPNKKFPEGIIFEEIIKQYPICISSVMIDSEFFFKKKLKFNSKYEIVGDYDFFIKLSKETNISVLREPLLIYSLHDKNTSNIKVELKIKEIEDMIENSNYLNNKQKRFLINENNYLKCNQNLKHKDYKNFFFNFLNIKNLYFSTKLMIKFFLVYFGLNKK